MGFVHVMFSREEVLLSAVSRFKGWQLVFRCDRCQRKAALAVPRPRTGDPVLAVFVARVRCGRCRAKPSAALLTNLRDASRVRHWANHDGAKGDMQILLWAPRHD
jgi:hypothetical protein